MTIGVARRPRRGVSLADVVVVLFLVGVVFLFIIMGMTRARESARLTICQRNLAQIGQALTYYDGAFRGLPTVSLPVAANEPMDKAPPGPLKTMLAALGVADFIGINVEMKNLPELHAPTPEGSVPVAGFFCPNDVEALARRFSSPVSYRASVGSDLGGTDGAFAVGRGATLKEVERRDGLSFTAAFAERLLGDGGRERSRQNYVVVDHVGSGESASGAAGSWRGDAGSTWIPADFRYTLYTHAQRPWANVSQVATDGRTSDMSASSSHVAGLNLLMLDGSARVVTPSIAPEVWRAYGSIGPEPTAPEN
ncbi:DUF1559 family PulG-like putative transporter [Paludisphaera rhizosphaerae]|uniref:DUF1559 family PulG-like putative transporter n=1 Tax=Paludisphaera rhizosphaerae TaxID=2711216 RepID=UPI0013EBFDC8|nr:DUF1559 domain-containing protein [Paludisphaera rhizosphaerae]